MQSATLPASLVTENRRRLAAMLPKGGIAVVNANDVLPSNADGTLPYRASSDMLYLTGIGQEETILVLFPGAPDEADREVLFLRETSELIAKWDGDRLSKAQAREASGIERVYWTHQFWEIFRKLVTDAEEILLNTNEHKRADVVVESRDARFIAECRHRYPLHKYGRLAPLLGDIRSIKQEEEIALIQKACDLTKDGFVRVLKFIKPGVNEREIEAELAHEFIRQGGSFADYKAILAGGKNATILHYHNNDQVLKDGELILMDFGAGWGGYNADMTRVAPVSGRFTDRQRAVYNAVLRVMKEATAMLRPGLLWKDWQAAAEKAVERECIALGLFSQQDVDNQPKDKPAFKAYFMHGLGHFLGLSVHDVGSFTQPMRAGQLFTVEPGIYIEAEGIGIRLENNVLITDNGPRDLMAHIPLEAEDIEAAMRG